MAIFLNFFVSHLALKKFGWGQRLEGAVCVLVVGEEDTRYQILLETLRVSSLN